MVVLNISSVAGKYGFEVIVLPTGAAKWGVHGFTEALRVELGSRNISPPISSALAQWQLPWWETNRNSPAGEIKRKMIRPEEVADAVRCADQASERDSRSILK